MAAGDDFGWRERAISVASLGAATLGRTAFKPMRPSDPSPLEMQVLVALAVGESLAADPPRRAGLDWLAIALQFDDARVADLVERLERAGLIRRPDDPRELEELRWELGEDDDEYEGEFPLAVTDLGRGVVDQWLRRTARLFAGWPPEPPDVDDVT